MNRFVDLSELSLPSTGLKQDLKILMKSAAKNLTGIPICDLSYAKSDVNWKGNMCLIRSGALLNVIYGFHL